MHSDRRCSKDVGSFAVTGMETVDKSFPAFFLRNPIMLGGACLGGSRVFRRLVGGSGSGVRDFGFGRMMPVDALAYIDSSAAVPSVLLASESAYVTGSSALASFVSSNSLERRMVRNCDGVFVPSTASKNSSLLVDSMDMREVETGRGGKRRALLSAIKAENPLTASSRSRKRAIHLSCTSSSWWSCCCDAVCLDFDTLRDPTEGDAGAGDGADTARWPDTVRLSSVDGARVVLAVLGFLFQKGRLS